MLDLAHIHKRSADRGENEPIIVAGGGCACNPEPIADFMDAIMIGDGEDMIMEVCDAVLAAKEAGLSRRDTLKSLPQYVAYMFRRFMKKSAAITANTWAWIKLNLPRRTRLSAAY